MVILLWILMALALCLLGGGVMRCLCGSRLEGDYTPGEFVPAGFCVLIGATEVFHLVAVFGGWSVSLIAFLWVGFISVLTIGTGILLLTVRKSKTTRRSKSAISKEMSISWAEQLLAGAFALSVVFQIIMIMTGNRNCDTKDMTLEMVRTFLVQDQIYDVNPLTGQPYTAGVPLRLQILCLPSLYAFLCRVTGLDAELVVCRVVPVTVLIVSYFAYSIPGKILFGRDRTGRLLMLFVISVLYWCGDYMESMDGFLLLHSGYRGVSIRNGILFPFTLGMCLQKNWKVSVLAILAEACIVWTLYGLGACLLVVVVMFVIHLWIRVRERRGGEACRNC